MANRYGMMMGMGMMCMSTFARACFPPVTR